MNGMGIVYVNDIYELNLEMLAMEKVPITIVVW